MLHSIGASGSVGNLAASPPPDPPHPPSAVLTELLLSRQHV
jgi:hypothetical protein